MRLKYLFWVFGGFVLGRSFHVYLNSWTGNVNWFPHHWIVGLTLVLAGWLGRKNGWGWMMWLGVGMFTSDFNDFWALKTFEPDVLGVKHFWQVD